jgi:hypothetical protein
MLKMDLKDGVGYSDGAACCDVDDNYAGYGKGYYYDGYYDGYVDAAVFYDFDGDGYDLLL